MDHSRSGRQWWQSREPRHSQNYSRRYDSYSQRNRYWDTDNNQDQRGRVNSNKKKITPERERVLEEKRKTKDLVENKLLSLTKEDKSSSIKELLSKPEVELNTESQTANVSDKDKESKRIAHVPKVKVLPEPLPFPPFLPATLASYLSPSLNQDEDSEPNSECLQENMKRTLIKDLLAMPIVDLKKMVTCPKSRRDNLFLSHLLKKTRLSVSEAMRKITHHKLQTEDKGDTPQMLVELENLIDPDIAVDVCRMPIETIHVLREIFDLDLDDDIEIVNELNSTTLGDVSITTADTDDAFKVENNEIMPSVESEPIIDELNKVIQIEPIETKITKHQLGGTGDCSPGARSTPKDMSINRNPETIIKLIQDISKNVELMLPQLTKEASFSGKTTSCAELAEFDSDNQICKHPSASRPILPDLTGVHSRSNLSPQQPHFPVVVTSSRIEKIELTRENSSCTTQVKKKIEKYDDKFDASNHQLQKRKIDADSQTSDTIGTSNKVRRLRHSGAQTNIVTKVSISTQIDNNYRNFGVQTTSIVSNNANIQVTPLMTNIAVQTDLPMPLNRFSLVLADKSTSTDVKEIHANETQCTMQSSHREHVPTENKYSQTSLKPVNSPSISLEEAKQEVSSDSLENESLRMTKPHEVASNVAMRLEFDNLKKEVVELISTGFNKLYALFNSLKEHQTKSWDATSQHSKVQKAPASLKRKRSESELRELNKIANLKKKRSDTPVANDSMPSKLSKKAISDVLFEPDKPNSKGESLFSVDKKLSTTQRTKVATDSDCAIKDSSKKVLSNAAWKENVGTPLSTATGEQSMPRKKTTSLTKKRKINEANVVNKSSKNEKFESKTSEKISKFTGNNKSKLKESSKNMSRDGRIGEIMTVTDAVPTAPHGPTMPYKKITSPSKKIKFDKAKVNKLSKSNKTEGNSTDKGLSKPSKNKECNLKESPKSVSNNDQKLRVSDKVPTSMPEETLLEQETSAPSSEDNVQVENTSKNVVDSVKSDANEEISPSSATENSPESLVCKENSCEEKLTKTDHISDEKENITSTLDLESSLNTTLRKCYVPLDRSIVETWIRNQTTCSTRTDGPSRSDIVDDHGDNVSGPSCSDIVDDHGDNVSGPSCSDIVNDHGDNVSQNPTSPRCLSPPARSGGEWTELPDLDEMDQLITTFDSVSEISDRSNLNHDKQFGIDPLHFLGHEGEIIDFKIYGKYMLVACADRLVHCYCLLSGKRKRVYGGHKGRITCLCISHLSKLLCTGCEDKVIRSFSIKDSTLLKTSNVMDSCPTVIDSDKKYIFVGLECGDVIKLKPKTMKIVERYPIGKGAVVALAVGSISGTSIFIAATSDLTLALKSVNCQGVQQKLEWNFNSPIRRMRLLHDELYCSSNVSNLVVFNFNSDESAQPNLIEVDSPIKDMTVIEQFVVAASESGDIFVVDTIQKTITNIFNQAGHLNCMSVFDNKVVLTGYNEGTLVAWPLPENIRQLLTSK